MSESAEVPFISGMEREPEKLCETTVKVGEKISRLDGMLERVLQKARMAMGQPDQGPADYDEFADERRFYQRMLRERGGNGPGSISGASRTLTTLVALNTALLVGIGGWLLVTVSQHDKDIAVMKCQIDAQCREALARARS